MTNMSKTIALLLLALTALACGDNTLPEDPAAAARVQCEDVLTTWCDRVAACDGGSASVCETLVKVTCASATTPLADESAFEGCLESVDALVCRPSPWVPQNSEWHPWHSMLATPEATACIAHFADQVSQ